MATIQIGIMHSGTQGRHDSHINAITDGIKSLGLSNTGSNPDFKVAPPKYAKDQSMDPIAQNLDSDTAINVIVAAGGTASALAAKNQTAKSGSGKPVVFTSVAAWPTAVANMTGIIAQTTKLDPDRLDRLAKLLPNNASVGVLLNAKRTDYLNQKAMLTTEAGNLGLTPDFQDIDPAAATAVETQISNVFKNWKGNVAGVLVAADPLFNNHRPGATGIIFDAAANNLPTIYQWSEFVDDGGLISYGTNLSVAYFLAGIYVGKIVKGATPASLTPLPLTNMEMVINLQTAGSLQNFGGVPPELLASADRIITGSGGHIPLVRHK
jgi:putative tryptophan/tyrosine transport system substrate-binding protein